MHHFKVDFVHFDQEFNAVFNLHCFDSDSQNI